MKLLTLLLCITLVGCATTPKTVPPQPKKFYLHGQDHDISKHFDDVTQILSTQIKSKAILENRSPHKFFKIRINLLYFDMADMPIGTEEVVLYDLNPHEFKEFNVQRTFEADCCSRVTFQIQPEIIAENFGRLS